MVLVERTESALAICEPVVSSRRRRRLARGARWIGVVLGLVGVVVGVAYLSLPSADDARARVDRLVVGHGGVRTRSGVSGRALQALVAVEDRRFFSHGAVDVQAIARAVVHGVTGQSGDAGGSTIAQQLAKALYGAGALKDIGMAFKLERRFTKAAILRMYADAIYYGNGYWGIEQASRGYFERPVSRLDWAEASLLAGLPQAPSAFNPEVHFDRARARQRVVLRALVGAKVLTRAGARRAYGELTSLRR